MPRDAAIRVPTTRSALSLLLLLAGSIFLYLLQGTSSSSSAVVGAEYESDTSFAMGATAKPQLNAATQGNGPIQGLPISINCGANSVEGLAALATAHSASRRRALLGEAGALRRLQACGTGCMHPRLDPSAVPSYPVLLEITFSRPFDNYAVQSLRPPMAFGICYVLGCNYRNVTVTYVAGDIVRRADFVYSVVFYTMPGSSNVTAFPAALLAALPSTSTSTVGTIAYGMSFVQGGAISTITGVYVAGAGPSASTYVPPAPPPRLPPMTMPPTPPSPPTTFTCTCTGGWSGADCLTPPGSG